MITNYLRSIFPLPSTLSPTSLIFLLTFATCNLATLQPATVIFSANPFAVSNIIAIFAGEIIKRKDKYASKRNEQGANDDS